MNHNPLFSGLLGLNVHRKGFLCGEQKWNEQETQLKLNPKCSYVSISQLFYYNKINDLDPTQSIMYYKAVVNFRLVEISQYHCITVGCSIYIGVNLEISGIFMITSQISVYNLVHTNTK